MTTRHPLYGHTSPETAIAVENYPYGRLRTTMYYWQEDHPKRGTRFMSQTINPKNGKRNKPHASTYSLIAGQLYRDDATGHVKFAGLSEYSDAREVLAFVRDFPACAATKRIRIWTLRKIAYANVVAAEHAQGKSGWAINGVPTALRPEDVTRNAEDLAAWKSVAELLREAADRAA